MALREEFEKTGNWLFRWRSYLPLGLAIIILAGLLYDQAHIEKFVDVQVWKIFCMAVSYIGLCIRIYIIGYAPHGTSGGNTRRKVANILNTTGGYSIVRHPLYLGNFLIWLGVSAFLGLWWMSFIFVLIFWIYYERIMYAEEEFLKKKFGRKFDEWAETTPAFLPRLKSWKRPTLPFSVRKVLRREYSPFFSIISTYTVLEIVSEYAVKGYVKIEVMWVVLFFSGLAVYMTLRALKKKTHLLDEEYDADGIEVIISKTE